MGVSSNSDLEMMEATVDGYINGYVQEGKPFHAYYMTVSGHGYYSWGGNAMSRKHREAVEAKYPSLSETSQAYLACAGLIGARGSDPAVPPAHVVGKHHQRHTVGILVRLIVLRRLRERRSLPRSQAASP